MLARPLFENPASVLNDPAEHATVVRIVLSRWLAGRNTAEIHEATGITEAVCARIVAAYQDRRHERATRRYEGARA